MRHATFAHDLRPSQQAALIEQAVARIDREARVVTFTHGCGDHTYVAVELSGRAGRPGECVTWLVCPQNLQRYHVAMLPEPTIEGEVYLDSGHYGMNAREVIEDVYARANR